VNAVSSEPDEVLVSGERQRMMVAHLVANRFFRRELLRANTGWPLDQLTERGAEGVLSTESTWKVGYAPDSYTRLIDHLREHGFDFRTLIKAGLAEWSEEGHAVDQFRDRLMFLARDEGLDPVGFVAIGREAQPTFTTTPPTLIHRPSNALVGLGEQIDLFAGGAITVVVDHPFDAMAIEQVSRLSNERWAGVPLCRASMSTAQAKTLYRYTANDTVILALTGDEAWQSRAIASLSDLSYFFRRVHAVVLPDGHTPSTLYQAEDGPQRLHDALVSSRPLANYQPGRPPASELHEELGPAHSGPSL
jgi:DNA primase